MELRNVMGVVADTPSADPIGEPLVAEQRRCGFAIDRREAPVDLPIPRDAMRDPRINGGQPVREEVSRPEQPQILPSQLGGAQPRGQIARRRLNAIQRELVGCGQHERGDMVAMLLGIGDRVTGAPGMAKKHHALSAAVGAYRLQIPSGLLSHSMPDIESGRAAPDPGYSQVRLSTAAQTKTSIGPRTTRRRGVTLAFRERPQIRNPKSQEVRKAANTAPTTAQPGEPVSALMPIMVPAASALAATAARTVSAIRRSSRPRVIAP
jgi:hypothetical protein